MADAIMKRQVTALVGRCYAGLDVADLRDEVLRRLRRIVSLDAAFFGTVDPQTLLFTSAVAEEPLGAATPLFLDNEYGRGDVNKFAALAEAADPVGSLDRATRGQRPDSARYREVMSPLGLGDELRAVLISGKQCWGAICLHREDAEHGFDDREVDVIRLRSRAGQWLSLHASRLGGGPVPQIGIVIEPTPAAQLSSLLLSAYGLTSAQSRVVALVIRGHSTRQIVGELHISAHTVQEHLTAAFDKFGVRSRRELVTAMLTGRPG